MERGLLAAGQFLLHLLMLPTQILRLPVLQLDFSVQFVESRLGLKAGILGVFEGLLQFEQFS